MIPLDAAEVADALDGLGDVPEWRLALASGQGMDSERPNDKRRLGVGLPRRPLLAGS
jgi:hypothetical protein